MTGSCRNSDVTVTNSGCIRCCRVGACSQIKMLADNPDQWALLLGAAFPNSSNFFLVSTGHAALCLLLLRSWVVLLLSLAH